MQVGSGEEKAEGRVLVFLWGSFSVPPPEKREMWREEGRCFWMLPGVGGKEKPSA